MRESFVGGREHWDDWFGRSWRRQIFGAYSVHGLTIGSPEDDVGVVLVLERRLLAAAIVVAGLLLEEAAPSASAVCGRLLGLAAAAAVGPRAARGHRAGRRARLPAAVARAARHRQLTVAEDNKMCC